MENEKKEPKDYKPSFIIVLYMMPFMVSYIIQTLSVELNEQGDALIIIYLLHISVWANAYSICMWYAVPN